MDKKDDAIALYRRATELDNPVASNVSQAVYMQHLIEGYKLCSTVHVSGRKVLGSSHVDEGILVRPLSDLILAQTTLGTMVKIEGDDDDDDDTPFSVEIHGAMVVISQNIRLAEHSSYFRGLLSGSFCHPLRHVCTGLSLCLRLVFPGGVAFPLQAHQVWHFSDMSSQTILHALRVDLAYLLC
ncbi:hypothetical protein Q3G72_018283 [Acer saccharum]|nr:hypothetical protein Q3G72_018283 [Acer saccharum]